MHVPLLIFAIFVVQATGSRFAPGAKERLFGGNVISPADLRHELAWIRTRDQVIEPRFFIMSMFSLEADVWYANMPSLLQQNITVPGASPVYPHVHCTSDGFVCQMTLGEGEINAAASLSALLYSGLFQLKKTYFMVAGVGGVNPYKGTTGSVAFARYAVQFDLQFEFDARQIGANYSFGYFPQFSEYPDQRHKKGYPGDIYGTEAFEINANLRNRFTRLARTHRLKDSAAAKKYRKAYEYAPANQPPSVIKCATGTSNVFWSGSLLGEAFANYAKLLTNGKAVYCMSQQEDNAILEVLLRGDVAGIVDFARVAILRTASDFDRAPPSEQEVYHLIYANQQGFDISIENIFVAGHPIVEDVVNKWHGVYEKGIKPSNYIGNIFNTLHNRHSDLAPPE